MADFQHRLKNLRKREMLSGQELLVALQERGAPINYPSIISQYESGQRFPQYETLILMADFFNTSIDYLVGRSDDPNPFEVWKRAENGIVYFVDDEAREDVGLLLDTVSKMEPKKRSLALDFLRGLEELGEEK